MGNILVQDNFANTIFFEYGAESGVLEPPFDDAGPRGSGDKSGSYVRVVDSIVRSGSTSIEIYQKAPPKSDAQRRVGVFKYGESSYPREAYLSWWVYFPNEPPWNSDDKDGWGTNIGGWKLCFGPPDNRWQWWTGGRFHVDKSSREVIFDYAWHKYPVIGVRKDWIFHSGFYVDENLNQWIHFQIYYKITTDSDSVIRAWVNNKLFAEKTTWDSIYYAAAPEACPEWNEYDCDWASGCRSGRPHMSAKLYDGKDSKEKRIWVDDIVWATQKVLETYEVMDK